MNPVRVDLTMALARELGVFDTPGVSLEAFAPADDDLLGLVHDPDYIAAVRAERIDPARGLGPGRQPGLLPACTTRPRWSRARRSPPRARSGPVRPRTPPTSPAGCTTRCAAPPSGFCVYNDPAIAIAWLLDQGARKVAYVDVDVHHGDGVQAAFYDDPRVLTISLHETPRTLFPGTGLPQETGAGLLWAPSVNVALPPGTGRQALAAGVRRGRPAAAAGVRAGGPGDPAGLRQPRRWTRSRTSR